MADVNSSKEQLAKEIDRLRKRIQNLNDSISLQANKIGNTNMLIVIAREEKILRDRIDRKKKALTDLTSLRKQRNQTQH
ncbi:hypothetical protein KAH55_12625 [bacterium]|nr:hypothetical protein [bacterium]